MSTYNKVRDTKWVFEANMFNLRASWGRRFVFRGIAWTMMFCAHLVNQSPSRWPQDRWQRQAHTWAVVAHDRWWEWCKALGKSWPDFRIFPSDALYGPKLVMGQSQDCRIFVPSSSSGGILNFYLCHRAVTSIQNSGCGGHMISPSSCNKISMSCHWIVENVTKGHLFPALCLAITNCHKVIHSSWLDRGCGAVTLFRAYVVIWGRTPFVGCVLAWR